MGAMDPPKRRRSVSPAEPPLAQDDTPDTERSPKRQRQSFLSPTRASLSRHNPDVLERRLRDDDNNARSRSSRTAPASQTSMTDDGTSQRAGTSTSQPTSMAAGGGGRGRDGRSSPSRAIGGGMAAQARRTPNAFRPSPAVAARRSIFAGPARRPSAGPGENPFMGRTLRRSPPPQSPGADPRPSSDPGRDTEMVGAQGASVENLPITSAKQSPREGESSLFFPEGLVVPHVEPPPPPESEEPELPPTPTQLGIDDPIVTTPPSGIHNTPSKRRSTGKGKITKSSPLKQPPLRPSSPTRHSSPSPGTRDIPSHLPSSAEDETHKKDIQDTNAPHPARNILPPDPEADKKKAVEKLRSQISRLERDISLAARLNDRILAAEKGQRDLSNNEKTVLLDLLRRTEIPKEDKDKKHEKSLQDVLNLLLNPGLMLGLPPSQAGQQKQKQEGMEDMEKELKDHLPIKMTEEESLPFLQAFTPLRYESRVVILPREKRGDEEGPLLQKHEISVKSPDGIFHAKIDMTVDTSIPAITKLEVPRIEPAAEPELRVFLRSVVGSGETDRNTSDDAAAAAEGLSTTSMRRNGTIVGWAMGEWYRVALRRARVWAALERELGSKDDVLGSVARLRARRKKRWLKRRKGKQGGGAEEEEEEADEDGGEGEGMGEKEKVTVKVLRPHMGRRSMDFHVPLRALDGVEGGDDDDNPEAKLRVEWNIEFDWTGEARSRVGVLVGVPGKWHKTDNSGSISRIPGMFDGFVSEDKDPMAAVRTVVALLAGDIGTLGR